MLCVEIRLAFKCPGCDHAVPINGIYRKIKCPDCQEILDIPKLRDGRGWQELLNFGNPAVSVFQHAQRMRLGETERGAFAPIKLDSTRKWPSCTECGETISEELLANPVQLGDMVTCAKCGSGMSLHPAPSLLTDSYPCARWIVGGAVELGEVTTEAEFQKLSHPVVMKCLNCGGTLTIDGTQRLVPCAYCNSPNYLPDDLWSAIHPQPKRERWYILFA
jgi:DNA-directed RNA polymerase subunit RPC12/RpoP